MNNDSLFKQMVGVTMECTLGPNSANFFWVHIDEQRFNNQTLDKPKLYLIHIDEIFAVFDDDEICEPL